MGARRWGRACGTSRPRSTVQARAAARPFLLRDHAPAVLLLIGLLLLTGAILAAAPAAQAGPTAYIWDGEGDGLSWSDGMNWNYNTPPYEGSSLEFPSPELGAVYTGGRCVNDGFLTTVGNVTIGTEGHPNDITVGGSAVGMSGQLTAYGANTWSVASTTAMGPLVVRNNVYTPPPPEDPEDPAPEFISTLTISGDIQLVDGGVGYPLTFGLGAEGDGTRDGIAVTGDVDGADAACDVTADGYGTVRFSGAGSWGGDTTSESAFLYFDDPASLPATSAVQLGATESSYGMAFFDFSGHSETYTMPNVFSGATGISFQNAKVELAGDSSAFSGQVWVPEFGAEPPSADVTVTGKLGAAVQLAAGGTLRGTGTVSEIGPGGDNTNGDISPGVADSSVGVLRSTGRVMPMNGGSYTVDMTDALGVAGIGHDCLDVGGDLWLGYVGSGGHMSVRLRSDVGGASNFNPALQYTWDVMHVTGEVTLFDPSAFVVDTIGFHNEKHGFFRIQKADGESGGATIQLVYTPTDTHTWDGEAGWDDQTWSNPVNWEGDSLPSNGDDLVFPEGTAWNPINDDLLTAVGSVDLGSGIGAYGSAVTVAGLLFGRAFEDWGSGWGCPTTLRDDTTISTIPSGNPTGAPFSIGEVSLEDSFGVGHTLTVDPVDSNRVSMEGGLTGKGALVKKGSGVLLLGGYWSEIGYTWDGPTDVQAGTLWIMTPGALSSHTDVHVDGIGTVAASFPEATTTDVWSNAFTGSGHIAVEAAALTMTAASESFFGAVDVAAGSTLTQTGSFPADTSVDGLLRGTGTVGALEAHGSVSPGIDDFEAGTLSGGGAGMLYGGASYVCDVSDVDEPAGSGYDQLRLNGEAVLAETADTPVTVALRSGAGGTEGPATGFDGNATYRWEALRAGASIRNFSSDAVVVDPSAFVAQNPTATGGFTLEVTDHATYQTLDVVYTPVADTHVWDGGGGNDKWSTAANWVGDTAPIDGDAVRFAGATRKANSNDLLTSVSGVEFANGGWLITGDAFATTGDIDSEATSGNTWIQQAVTLTDDVAITSATDGQLNLLRIHLSDGVAGHGLTLGGTGIVNVVAIDGAGTDCTLTKTGQGAAYLVGPNTFGGAVTISEGTLRLLDTQAIPAGVPVGIADSAMLWVESTSGDKTFTLDNVISGTSRAILTVWKDTLRLTGDSSGYAGSEQPCVGGTLRVDGKIGGSIQPNAGLITGIGTIGRMVLSNNGILSPGRSDYGIGGLKATGDVELMGDSTYRFDVANADGDPGQGYDNLRVAGPTGGIVASMAGWPCAVVVRSSDESGPADAASFDPARAYRWHLVTATSGSITHFAADKFTLDTTGFSNDLEGGSFSLDTSADGKSLDLVFSPSDPYAHVWTGLSLTGDQWSHRFNWLGGVAPQNGDDLEFIGLLRQTNVNDLLTTVGDVHLWNGDFVISGDPVELNGTLRSDAGFSSNTWSLATTLGADVTVQSDCGWLGLDGAVHLADGATGHALSVTGSGTTEFSGGIDGAGAACSLTKEGAGELVLRGANTFGGAVTVGAGTVWARGAQALPADVPVGVAADAGLIASTLGKGGGGAGTWNNVLSGAGSLTVYLDYLRLTGESPAFTGATSVDGGVLVVDGSLGGGVTLLNSAAVGGDGSVGSVVAGDGGYVWPGVVDLAPATLAAAGVRFDPCTATSPPP